jgi:tetratricopeptide (TPR) repeat protein
VRHQVVLDELVEWWEDLSRSGIGSRTVLVLVPPRWGRTTLLKQLAAIIHKDDALSVVVSIPGGSLPDGVGLQAQRLRDLLLKAELRRRAAELLGMDRLGGAIQLGLGVGGLFVPLAAAAAALLTGVAVGAAGRVWDDTPAGQEGALARAARAVAARSVSVPVVVLIDDADQLEPELAVTLVENLIERHDGQVLVVATADPGNDLVSVLTSRARFGLTEGRVQRADADPDMGYQARADLAAELSPRLPVIATHRIAQRTRTFADVFAVASAERLAELDRSAETTVLATVDQVIDAKIKRASPSPEAVLVAWSGGVLHASQADRALSILGAQRSDPDAYIARFESLVRLADPASPGLAVQVSILATGTRHRLATAVLDAAADLDADPRTSLVERVVAWQAVHRVRADLDDRQRLAAVQCQLVHGLEALGDLTAAYEVAHAALAEYLNSHPGNQHSQDRDELTAAVLRLARTRTASRDDPLVEKTVVFALAGGAAVGLEARIWAAIDLLDQPDKRETALKLVDEVTAELGTRNDLGPVGDRWRLLLAFHVGRAGYPAVSQRLLTSMLTASPEQWDTAQAVLFAVARPQADIRLQVIVLEAELRVTPDEEYGDLLRLYSALGSAYERLGDYPQSLVHAEQELLIRIQIQGADHPDTLGTRWTIATMTGRCGNATEALRLLEGLLPDQERILGPHHQDTLGTRAEIAHWVGEAGNAAEALRLFKELLPDLERVVGRDHHQTLSTRNSIASLTGKVGDPPGALRLLKELLPDRERVLGPDHPDTLTTRSAIVSLTR